MRATLLTSPRLLLYRSDHPRRPLPLLNCMSPHHGDEGHRTSTPRCGRDVRSTWSGAGESERAAIRTTIERLQLSLVIVEADSRPHPTVHPRRLVRCVRELLLDPGMTDPMICTSMASRIHPMPSGPAMRVRIGRLADRSSLVATRASCVASSTGAQTVGDVTSANTPRGEGRTRTSPVRKT